VLKNDEEELLFREKLVDFYSAEVPDPCDHLEKGSILRAQLECIGKEHLAKKMERKSKMATLFGLGEVQSPTLDMTELQPELVANQITLIHAEIYRQLCLSEILDLRFQKDKGNSPALNRVHEFSNKVRDCHLRLAFHPLNQHQIYLTVPTTILAPDDPSTQILILKKWVTVASVSISLLD
jgi:hypothetical protein